MRVGVANDVRRFCNVDGWQRKADQPGRRVAKHEVWVKTLPDGATLRTVISKGRGTFAKGVFAAIVTRQLRVSHREFWAAVDKGVPPRRAGDTGPPTGQRLPYHLVAELLTRGHTLGELRGLNAEQAARLLEE